MLILCPEELYMMIPFVILAQIVELQDHPYYIGVQFHPEFKSRPGKPSALFFGNLCDLLRYVSPMFFSKKFLAWIFLKKIINEYLLLDKIIKEKAY